MSSKSEFVAALYAAAEVFNEAISKTRVELYWAALCDLPVDELLASLSETIRSSTFFPKPAEIREWIEESDEVQADLAWGNAIATIGRTGWQKEGLSRFEDEDVRVAIQAVGGYLHLFDHLSHGNLMAQAERRFKRVLTYSRRGKRVEKRAEALSVKRAPSLPLQPGSSVEGEVIR